MATYLITSKAEKEEAAAIEALRPRRPAPYPANPRKFEGQYILPCGVTVPAREIMEIKGYVLHKNGRYTIYNQADMPINLDTTREVWAFFRLIDSVRPSSDERNYQDRGFIHPLTMTDQEYLLWAGLRGWKKRTANSGEAFQLEHPIYGRTRTWDNGSIAWAARDAKSRSHPITHEREEKDNLKIRLDGPMNGEYHLAVLEYTLVDTNAWQYVTRHEEHVANHTEALGRFKELAARVKDGLSPIPFPRPEPEPEPEPEPDPPIAAVHQQPPVQTKTCGLNSGPPGWEEMWMALPGGNGTKSTVDTLAAIRRSREARAHGTDLEGHRAACPRDADRYEGGVGVDIAKIKSDLIDKITAISQGKRPPPNQFLIIAGSWRVERSNGENGVLELFHASRPHTREPIGSYHREGGSEFWRLTAAPLDPVVRRLVARNEWTILESEEDLEELPY